MARDDQPKKVEVIPEALFSEFVGTFFLVFTVGLNVLQRTALAPVSIGCILMVMIFATGGVSGAHYNPAVTLGVLLADRGRGNFDWQNALAYVTVQLFAGAVAGACYFWILGATFTLQPGAGYNWLDAAAVEVLFTSALVFVVLSTACTKQDEGNHYYGLAIGFTVMAAAFACGPISGCSLNPAVTFGVMMTNWVHTQGGLQYLALYMICPLVGSLLAVLFFSIVRMAEYVKDTNESPKRAESA